MEWAMPIYSASSNSIFSAFLRYCNKVPGVENLYFTSGSTHRGRGIPLTLLSGCITVDTVRWDPDPYLYVILNNDPSWILWEDPIRMPAAVLILTLEDQPVVQAKFISDPELHPQWYEPEP